jgi:NADH dehydrogenase (ubiquinone) Fe-S protein 6
MFSRSLARLSALKQVIHTEGTIQQAANRSVTWSAHQQDKSVAMNNVRFEQTDLASQPNPMAAIELISQVPVAQVDKRIVACNGGGGALGHPRVYINLVL